MEKRVDGALAALKTIFRDDGGIEFVRVQEDFDRDVWYCEVSNGIQKADFVLSWEFLVDFSGSDLSVESARSYARSLGKRMSVTSPDLFYCISNVPIRVEITWEAQPTNKAATALRVRVRDLRRSNEFAKLGLVITERQSMLTIKHDPFLREQLIVNSIRQAIDKNEIRFVPATHDPLEVQMINLQTTFASPSARHVEGYLCGKVFWLGFKQNASSSQAWIADDWDSSYLNVERKTLLQTAEIVAARNFIELANFEYARATNLLLVSAREWEV